MATRIDAFGARATLGGFTIYRLDKLAQLGLAPNLERLPFSIKILLEAVLRNVDNYIVNEQDVKNLAAWDALNPAQVELPFMPARVVMQDFTGVPCVVDLAAMRDAMKQLGGDPFVPIPTATRDGEWLDRYLDSGVAHDYWGPCGDVECHFRLRDRKGGDEAEWPEDLRGCRAWPEMAVRS